MTSGTDLATTTRVLAERPSLPTREIDTIIDICMSASERLANGRLQLRNMPSVAERQLLGVRARQLLDSFKKHDRKEIAALVADMLAAYDVAQAKQLTAADRKAAVTVYVRELAGLPTWAIADACNKIRLGMAPGISHQFKPTPIQLRVLATSIAQPWKREALQIGEILAAEQYREGPSEEERGRLAIRWRSLADALGEGAVGEPGLRHEIDRVEQERAAARLRRAAEISREVIKREWAAAGEQPPPGQLVSRSLVNHLAAAAVARGERRDRQQEADSHQDNDSGKAEQHSDAGDDCGDGNDFQ